MIEVKEGDCLEVMGEMESNSVSVVVTSPPYNLGGDIHRSSNEGRLRFDYDNYGDDMAESEYQKWQVNVLRELYRLVEPGGWVFYNHKIRLKDFQIIDPLSWIKVTNWRVYQVIVLDGGATPNTDNVRCFPVTERLYILTNSPGARLDNRYNLTDIWKIEKRNRRLTGHPATFSHQFVSNCISLVHDPPRLVFDPFLGTGTTLEVCVMLGLDGIGVEISPKYCNIARENIYWAIREKNSTRDLSGWL